MTPDLLVRQIQPQEIRGLLSKTLIVEEGQVAVLLVEGRHDATLSPGKHSIGNILTSRGRDATVLLFRASDVAVDTSVARLLTADPLSLTLDCRLTLKLENPLVFWTNLMQGADSYSVQHLRAAIYTPLEEACRSFIRSRSVELASD